jgi:quinol monooxygenase YgiN
MLLIAGTIRLPPEKLQEALPKMKRMIESSLAEDGCMEYSYGEDVLNTGLIHVKEVWRDQASLDRHFQSAHLAEWRMSWPHLGVRDRDLAVYEVSEPRRI